MGWVAFYLFLAIAFIGAIFFHSGTHITVVDIVKSAIASGTAIASAIRVLTRTELRAYLWQQRIRLRFAKGDTVTWVFAQRLDDLGDTCPLAVMKAALNAELRAWTPQLLSEQARSLQFIVQRTIHLKVTFVPSGESEDSINHMTIESYPLEVSYGQAVKKLDGTIIPLLTSLQALLRPKDSSVSLRAEFVKANPFFSFYTEHLKPEQVKDFVLSFRPTVSLAAGSDLVVVTQHELAISSGSIEAFSRLAKGFLLLSAEIDNFTKG